jgi:hypothetical protein
MTWNVYFRLDDDTKPPLQCPDDVSRVVAMKRACALVAKAPILYIKGPDDDLIGRDEILEWCSAHNSP